MPALPLQCRAYLILLISIFVVSSPYLSAREFPLKIKRFSQEDGLPTSPIAGQPVQDKFGFIWFGTWSGLYKYDGYTFTGYWHNSDDSLSISHDWAFPYIDRKGRFWIGTQAGLDRFYPETGIFLHYKHNSENPASISRGGVTAICDDSQGFLWVGTEEGLNRFEPQSGRFKRYTYNPVDESGLYGNQVRVIYEDRNGEIWIGTGNPFSNRSPGCLNLYDPESDSFRHYFPEPANKSSQRNFIQSIYQEPEGNLWLGAWEGGLYKFDSETGQFTAMSLSYPINPNRGGHHGVNWISEQPGTDILWLSTFGGGLNRFNLKTGENSTYLFNPNDPFSLSDNRVWSAVVTKDILWVGTHTGLNRIDLAGKFPYYNAGLKTDEWATDIYEDKTGIIWLATSDMRLLKWDRVKQQSTAFVPTGAECAQWRIPGAVVTGSKNGNLWFVNTCGLFEFNPLSNQFTNINRQLNKVPAITSDQPLRVIEDKHNKLWFASHPLTAIDLNTREVHQYTNISGDSSSINANDIDSIFEDADGNIWVGTIDGLARYQRQTNNFINMLDTGYEQSTAVTDITQDSDGFLCLATDTYGYVRLNPATGKWTQHTVQNGMHTNSFYNIVYDDSGIWLFSPSGATRFIPQTGGTKFYDRNDGLVETQYSLRAAYRSSAGEIILGGRGSVNLFKPEDYLGNTEPPKVVLTGLRIAGELLVPGKNSQLTKSVAETEAITLAHYQNDLTFEFVALDYKNAMLNQYQYRLNNYDVDWSVSSTGRNARYTNLPPGDYVFHVKAANSAGIWNEAGTSITISILTPWWKTGWAYILYIALTLTVLYGVRSYEMNRVNLKNRLRLEQIEAEKFRDLDQMKSRFFANISHEFRTPLTLVLGQINAVFKDITEPGTKGKLAVAKRNAQRLLQLVSQLLDLSKLESGSMNLNLIRTDVLLFLKNLVFSFESMAHDKSINLHFICEEDEIVLDYEPDKLEMIITNLISNALKFTPEKGDVSVKVSQIESPVEEIGRRSEGVDHAGLIEIQIKDTGIGISSEKLSHIFDRFFQVEDTDKRSFEGTGIGLALVKELVDLYSGQIEVESKVNVGTTFIVQLPLRQPGYVADKQQQQPADQGLNQIIETEEQTTGKPQSIQKDRQLILVVEDNADLRAYMRQSLDDFYSVLEAVDGQQGLARAQETIPDLIISDVMMPNTDGYEFSTAIRGDERTSHIPIIMLTAKAGDENRLTGLEVGVDDYLIKPFNVKELLVRIANLIKIRQQLKAKFSMATIIKPADVAATSVDQAFLKKVLDTIETNMSEEEFNVERLAAEVNMSEAQLNRKLNALINQPPGQLLRSMRLQRAADLLTQDAGNIAEICYQVGFSDQANFTRSFKKQFGVAPRRYGKNI